MTADPTRSEDLEPEDHPVRVLVLWCPDWPIVAWRREAPDQRDDDLPVAVLDTGARGPVVRAASSSARAEGVTRGLRRREAEARCAGLVVVDTDHRAEAVAFEEIARALESVTPRVEIERPGRLVFPTRGPARYFGGEGALAERVLAAVGASGVRDARVAIADGIFAATLAARRAGPGAAITIPPGGSPTFLAGLPTRAIVGDPDAPDASEHAELAALLVRLGVHTLGDFASLAERAVLARFGTLGARAHRRARGLDTEAPSLGEVPAELTRTCALDPPAERLDTVAFAAKAMADELLDDLARRGLACTRIIIEAETEHGESLSRCWRHEGALSALALATRVHWQLESWLTGTRRDAPSAGLVLLRLVPDGVVAATGRQLGFWGGDAAADEAARRVLVRVQGMLGVDAVVRPVPTGGRTPAERIRWIPWGEQISEVVDAPWPGRVPGPAPVTVYDRPIPARLLDANRHEVTMSARGEVSGDPVRLESAVLSGRVCRWAGPWPHEVRWWDRVTRTRRVLWQLVVERDDASPGAGRPGAGRVDACLVEMRGSAGVLTALYA